MNLEAGVLNIRASKNHRQREVLLHASATLALAQYTRVRDEHFLAPDTPEFFLSSWGRPLRKEVFWQTFRVLIKQAGLEGRGERARPRPHDLRHTFAVQTLIGWHRAGEDIDRKMPALSTYLGHVSPESTYWYLQSVPELIALASERLERIPEGLS